MAYMMERACEPQRRNSDGTWCEEKQGLQCEQKGQRGSSMKAGTSAAMVPRSHLGSKALTVG